jgi:hypothetical protein
MLELLAYFLIQKMLILSVRVLSEHNFERINDVTNFGETLNVMRYDTSVSVVIYSKLLLPNRP